MEKINHFSHENHPLKLLKPETIVGASVNDGGDKKPGLIGCYMCVKPISSGFAYGCIQCCHFLHKTCAQLPPILTDPTLYHFPLKFDTMDMAFSRHWICDVCYGRKKSGMFSYIFAYDDRKIEFAACIDCCVVLVALKAEAEAIKEEARIKVEHESHPQHALILQLRPASFRCDACNSNDEGLFYQCDAGDFWIHKTCACLPPTIHLPYHHPHHHLLLVYSLPEKFFNFVYYCEFCKKYILRNVWLYHCANCRYFAHIKCALTNAQQPSAHDHPLIDSTSAADRVDVDVLHFPQSQAFTDPLKLLYSEKISYIRDMNMNQSVEIKHWSHAHLLILDNNMIMSAGDTIKVCHGCVRPVSLIPYYTCKDGCSFTLHKYCAELPLKLKHQLHPSHSLDLINISQQGGGSWRKSYKCAGCLSSVNTFLYKCETCKFYLDINCAYLPKSIKHKSHNHPLMQVMDPEPTCKACDHWYEGISYDCKACGFILDMYCAMRSPTSLSHRYCKGHQIPLTYPPIIDHAEDFYCDICEEEMHPKFPLYYCHKCRNTFHLDCISRVDLYENVIYEGTISVSYHRHPLTYARRNKTDPKFVCSVCNCDVNCFLILECHARVCNFNICYQCHVVK